MPAMVKKKILKAPKVIRIGSDFTGTDATNMAMARMFDATKYKYMFASDTLENAHKLSAARKSGNKPETFYHDVCDRVLEDVPATDLYTWTPPCTTYSKAGLNQGINAKAGKLLASGVKYVVAKKPRAAVMENVPNLLSKKHKHVVKGVNKALKKAGYNCYWKKLRASDYEVAQDRDRLFLVVIEKKCQRHEFTWPEPVTPRVTLADILDPPTPEDNPRRLPHLNSSKELVKVAYNACLAKGIDPMKTPIAVDIDCGTKYKTYGVNVAKTLTKARGGTGGPWISTRGRRTSATELMKIQGFKPCEIPFEAAGLSKAMLGKMLGDAVPVPMLGRVMAHAMYSAGVTKDLATFPV